MLSSLEFQEAMPTVYVSLQRKNSVESTCTNRSYSGYYLSKEKQLCIPFISNKGLNSENRIVLTQISQKNNLY